jgi:hypothetical protein
MQRQITRAPLALLFIVLFGAGCLRTDSHVPPGIKVEKILVYEGSDPLVFPGQPGGGPVRLTAPFRSIGAQQVTIADIKVEGQHQSYFKILGPSQAGRALKYDEQLIVEIEANVSGPPFSTVDGVLRVYVEGQINKAVRLYAHAPPP